MALAHPYPVRVRWPTTGPLAKRFAGLFAIRMPILGCIHVAPEGIAVCAVARRGAAVREYGHDGTRCPARASA